MRHALNVALQGFEGGLVIVSHDRHLIKTVADTLWLVADGKLRTFDGDLDDYQGWLKSRGEARRAVERPSAMRRTPSARDSLTRWRRELEQIERQIAAIAAERTRLEAAPRNPAEHGKLSQQQARLMRDAAALEARWMEVGTAIEEAEHRGR
jgi:ATP-binding cassette subfamily F protein 3